jgi:hypothetical protein
MAPILALVFFTILISFVLSFKHTGFVPWIVDFVHLFILYFQPLFVCLIIYEIAILNKYDVSKLLAINTVFIVMVLGVVVNRMCPLTTLYNKAANIHPCTPFFYDIRKRLNMKKEEIQYYVIDNDKCEKNTKSWLHGQLYTCLTLIFLNILFFIKYFRQVM